MVRAACEQDLRQAQQHQVDDPGLERPVGNALRPLLALWHHAWQLRLLAEGQCGRVLAALRLRHALGLGHVLVVVKRQDHDVAPVEAPLQVPRELPVYELVPRQRLPLESLHQLDLPVYEDGTRGERVARAERVRGFLLERVQP